MAEKTPTWDSITTSDDYQSLTPELRARVKSDFFESHIAPMVDGDEALKSIGREKVFNWFMQQPDDSGQSYPSTLIGSAVRGLGEMVPGSIEGAGALLGSERMRETGQSIRGSLEELAPVNPIYGESFPVKAVNVGGQVGGTILTGGTGGAIGKILGGASKVIPAARAGLLGTAGLQGAAEGARAAEEYGMTGGDAYLRTLIGAGSAIGTELLPFGQATELVTPARLLGAAPRATRFTTDTITEGLEEGAEQLTGNVATTALAPAGVETPGLTEGVLEATALGTVGGAMFGGINALSTPRAPAVPAGPVTEQAQPLPTGITINAGAPAVITPEFLEDASEADLAEAEQAGFITRPPIITAPSQASPVEQSVIASADAALKAAGNDVSEVVAALKEDEAITGSVTDVVLEEELPVETENESAASDVQSEAAGTGVPSKPEGGSIPSVTTPIVDPQLEESSAEIQTPQTNEPAIQQPDETSPGSDLEQQEVPSGISGIPTTEPGTAQEAAVVPGQVSEAPAAAEPADLSNRREQVIQQAEETTEPDITTGDPVVVKVNGNNVMGTVSKVNDDGTADVDYTWNGEDYAKVQKLLKSIRRPARSLNEGPSYSYTQEQNTRKAQRFGIPTSPGVTVNAGQTIATALRNIAKDTATSPMLRAAARALQTTSFDNVDLRIDTDGRRKYAGYYLHDQGITEIGLNLRHVARGNVDAVGTLIHEALHHATLAKVRDPQNDIERESVEALGKIVQRIRSYAGLQEQGKKFNYETSNIEEFISALFTRPDFQNFLASIPDSFSPKTGAAKFRSVLSEIFRIIAQIVTGHKVSKGSTMEQAMAASIILFDTPQRTIDTSTESPAMQQRDAEYLAAVEAGDMAKAQQMVDEAAQAAGLIELFHGSSANEDVKVFEDRSSSSGALAMGVYMSPDIETAQGYGKTGRYWVDIELPGFAEYNAGLTLDQIARGETTPVEGRSANGAWKIENGVVEVVVRRAAQIKSADPVVRDDQGRIVSLSQRFGTSTPAVRSRAQDELAQAAAVASGQTPVTTPKGLSSLMRATPVVGIPTTGPRGVARFFTMPEETAATTSIEEAYKQALTGKSTSMVSLREVFDKLGGTLTPEQFIAQVEADYNAGRILLEPSERPQTTEEARPFVARGAFGQPNVNMMVLPSDAAFSMAQDSEQPSPLDRATAYNALVNRFGKEVADKIRLGEFGPVAGRDWDGVLLNGEIALNLRFLTDEATTVAKAEHEMAHAVWQDPSVRQAWQDLRESMPQEVRDRIQGEVRDMGYDEASMDQETLVRYLEEVRASTPDSVWRAFWDAVVNAFRRLFGAAPDERTARVVAARIVAAGEAAVARGLPTDSTMFEMSRVDANNMRSTRSRFAPPGEEDQKYAVLTQEENDRQAQAWIAPLGTKLATDMVLAGKLPSTMETSVKENIVGTLLVDLTKLSTDTNLSEDARLVATAQAVELGKHWVRQLSQDPARALQQRAVQNARLFPFAPVLEAETILNDRANKIVAERFVGGTDQVVARINEIGGQTSLDADERVERILQTLIGSLGPKETARGALARMFRGTGQRDKLIDEVAKALMLKARGNTVAPERRTALANLVSSLKGTLAAQVKGEQVPAPEDSLPDLLTRAFVNQVAEGELFAKSWQEGRQQVLDMLIGLEMDKTFYPLERSLKDAQARLDHLEAGNAQQVAESTVERASLKQQISDIKDSMKAEKKAIAEMTENVLIPQRDALLPPSVPMAFDPASSKESIARAFEQAGYTAELATGMDKSGKRTLSMRDAVRDKKRAVAAVMNVFDEAMKPLDAATQNEWAKAIPVARQAVEDTLAAWQKQIDEAAAKKLELQKEKLLDGGSGALEDLVNTLRDKITGGLRWADILYDLPATQDARKQVLLDRLSKHEALQNLTAEESAKLATEVNKVWQHQRQRLFKKELKKAGVIKEKSLLDRAKVFDAAPQLLRFLNLGVFNSSTFRQAIAPHYGLRLISNEQATQLRKMASDAWNEPEGVLRNRKLRELLEQVQTVTKAPWSDIVNSYWTASVLSGLRTQFDTYMAVINGFGTNLIQAGAAMVRARSVQAGVDAHVEWWRGLSQGIKEAVLILAKGDTSYLKRFSDDVKKAMEGENGFSPVPTGERLWKEGNMAQKWLMAPVMIFTGRLMTAADHINNTATTQGAMAVARALHPDIYGGKGAFTGQEIADARKQAVREALGGKDPSTYAERRLVDARTREILNGGLSDADRAAASEIGDIAAFQNDPTGFFGAIYSSVKAGLSAAVRKFDEVAQDEDANKGARALSAIMAGTVHAITGTRFMRFGFNFGNDIIRYIPGSYLAGRLGFFGRETTPMQRDLLLGKNVVGLIMASIIASLFDDDDESKDDEWHIEGDWTSWSREDQAARRSAGLAPGTMWKRSKDGTLTSVRYLQWPTMGLFAAVGGMQDERRAKPEVWAQRGTAGHLLNAATIGAFQVQNVSAMRGLAELFGGTPSGTSGNSVESWKDKLIALPVNYAGGLAPTFIKDVEIWHDPQNYKADGVMERLMRGMPIARRYVNDGRPQLDLLGDPVELNRTPWSRTADVDELDHAHVVLGKLIARGHDLQMASSTRLVFQDGRKVPLETLGRDVVWRYEQAVGQGYKQWLDQQGDQLLAMPVAQADKVIDRRSRAIRDVELKKIQASLNR